MDWINLNNFNYVVTKFFEFISYRFLVILKWMITVGVDWRRDFGSSTWYFLSNIWKGGRFFKDSIFLSLL